MISAVWREHSRLTNTELNNKIIAKTNVTEDKSKHAEILQKSDKISAGLRTFKGTFGNFHVELVGGISGRVLDDRHSLELFLHIFEPRGDVNRRKGANDPTYILKHPIKF